ncbi:hypothetical protein GCM10022393_39170 [Aquimarina addita]|uniref:Uncharacterized protein n=2 Tax=Aquimarina addita TaxID=870485 RepID=A0ABP6UTH4_9FLAO
MSDQSDRLDSLFQNDNNQSQEMTKDINNVNPTSSTKNYYIAKSARQFKNRFNQFCIETNSSIRLVNVNINKGEINNTFQYMFNKNLGIFGSINKSDNTLLEVTMVGQGDGSVSSGVDIILTMSGIISSIQPDLSPNQRAGILKKLGFLDDKTDILNLERNTVIGNIKYWVGSSKYTGIMFGASNINNK